MLVIDKGLGIAGLRNVIAMEEVHLIRDTSLRRLAYQASFVEITISPPDVEEVRLAGNIPRCWSKATGRPLSDLR